MGRIWQRLCRDPVWRAPQTSPCQPKNSSCTQLPRCRLARSTKRTMVSATTITIKFTIIRGSIRSGTTKATTPSTIIRTIAGPIIANLSFSKVHSLRSPPESNPEARYTDHSPTVVYQTMPLRKVRPKIVMLNDLATVPQSVGQLRNHALAVGPSPKSQISALLTTR